MFVNTLTIRDKLHLFLECFGIRSSVLNSRLLVVSCRSPIELLSEVAEESTALAQLE
jgi:hypothetical protein